MENDPSSEANSRSSCQELLSFYGSGNSLSSPPETAIDLEPETDLTEWQRDKPSISK
jgi:hypothetical protein